MPLKHCFALHSIELVENVLRKKHNIYRSRLRGAGVGLLALQASDPGSKPGSGAFSLCFLSSNVLFKVKLIRL